MTTPMTRNDIVELMARALAKEDRIEICSDATYRLSAYGLRAQAALSALEAAGCQIVQGEPTYWHYRRGPLEGKIRLFCDPYLVDTGWTETPLYASKVQP